MSQDVDWPVGSRGLCILWISLLLGSRRLSSDPRHQHRVQMLSELMRSSGWVESSVRGRWQQVGLRELKTLSSEWTQSAHLELCGSIQVKGCWDFSVRGKYVERGRERGRAPIHQSQQDAHCSKPPPQAEGDAAPPPLLPTFGTEPKRLWRLKSSKDRVSPLNSEHLLHLMGPALGQKALFFEMLRKSSCTR